MSTFKFAALQMIQSKVWI